MRAVSLIAVLCCLCPALPAAATAILAEAAIGRECVLTFLAPAGLQTASTDPHAHQILRIAGRKPLADGREHLDLRFTSLTPGHFNVADWLTHDNGSPLRGTELAVQVIRLRESEAPGDLALAPAALPSVSGLGPWLMVAALGWVGLCALIWWRLQPRRAQLTPVVEPEPAISDDQQLAVLLASVDAAAADPDRWALIDRKVRGRLGILLGIPDGNAVAVLEAIQTHPEAGPLYRRFQQALYGPQEENSAAVRTARSLGELQP